MTHHTVIIVGGGPAGLPLSVVLSGLHPVYTGGDLFRSRHPDLDASLRNFGGQLTGMDFLALQRAGVGPSDLFRSLHHPGRKFRGLNEIAYGFERGPAVDTLLITRENVGGLWNNVPKNLLTLSPGQWMEFGFHPLAKHFEENRIDGDVNDLIIKHRLVDYYHSIPGRFEVTDRIRDWTNVTRISPHEAGFLVETEDLRTGERGAYTCTYLVYAVGQRCVLRQLGAPGADLPFVSQRYDSPDDFPGEHVMVVGGGRSADWAATELHDAGRQVTYVQRQPYEKHWPLIRDSLYLPYYARIAEIMESRSPRMDIRYETAVTRIDPRGEGGLVTLEHDGSSTQVEVDHVVLEIGGIADYSVLQGFGDISLVDKYDDYRFQVRQMRTHPHNYESIDIPNLYAGGYLAQDIGLVVYAMHGTTYPIAGDIFQKEGLLQPSVL